MSLASSDLFDGLPQNALDQLVSRSRHRRIGAGDYVCRQGDPGDTLLILEHGAADVFTADGLRLRRLRRGDVIGEVAVLTGEPRSATVRATLATDVVEIHRDALAAVLAAHPGMLHNLTRILGRRLASAHVEPRSGRRAEVVGIVLGPSASGLARSLVGRAAAASPGRVATVLLPGADVGVDADVTTPTTDAAYQAVDALLPGARLVFVLAGPASPDLRLLAAQADRLVVVGTAAEAAAVQDKLGSSGTAEHLSLDEGADDGAKVAWLARYLTRTRVGLALGAGGAKGYAHVAVIAALESAGYTVDAVAGSSIGAIVGAGLAMGLDSKGVDAALRERFSPDVVKSVFALSFSGMSAGYDTMKELTEGMAGDRTFADLEIPLTVMTVDLNTRLPAPISEGRLADALLAGTALAGLFPPFERDGQRLVDGLALVPVPVEEARTAGADVVVSVNLMSRETLPAWPGEEPPPPPGGRQRMLETLLEVMDLAQLDASVRTAATADVTITPRFGPSTWRDFHLADRFLAAGQEAAEAALPALAAVARPNTQGETDG